jgi:hypothetical protein
MSAAFAWHAGLQASSVQDAVADGGHYCCSLFVLCVLLVCPQASLHCTFFPLVYTRPAF